MNAEQYVNISVQPIGEEDDQPIDEDEYQENEEMEDVEHLDFSAKKFFGNRATRASVLSLEEQRLSLRFTTT